MHPPRDSLSNRINGPKPGLAKAVVMNKDDVAAGSGRVSLRGSGCRARNTVCRRNIVLFLLALMLSCFSASYSDAADTADLPDRVFAPYVDVLKRPVFSMVDTYRKTGQKYFTLAFVLSGGGCTPSWGGVIGMDDDWYKQEIDGIRATGGDVIVSFGGAGGTELALSCNDVNQLRQAYQAVIDRYQPRWIDLDIEAMALADGASVDRRNRAIQKLQAANPRLKVAYCLPVMPSGLTADALKVLGNARDNGVRVDLVNIMAMDYGDSIAPNPEGLMGAYAIQAARATRQQLLDLAVAGKIGITPMIGQNDVPSERFYLSDARQLLDWSNEADQRDWVALLSMWSANRDNGGCPASSAQRACSGIRQDEFDFIATFVNFGSGDPAGLRLPSPFWRR